MAHIAREILRSFVSERIVLFHQARLEALKRMNLEGVLRKKNPYFSAPRICFARVSLSLL